MTLSQHCGGRGGRTSSCASFPAVCVILKPGYISLPKYQINSVQDSNSESHLLLVIWILLSGKSGAAMAAA